MTIISTDGRPPSRRFRLLEWRWFLLGAVLVLAGAATGAIVAGISLRAILTGAAIGLLLLVGAIPVLAAGLLRGDEERLARKVARIERPEGRAR